jgi:hypothetical protein
MLRKGILLINSYTVKFNRNLASRCLIILVKIYLAREKIYIFEV